jgi:hypothetical protein
VERAHARRAGEADVEVVREDADRRLARDEDPARVRELGQPGVGAAGLGESEEGERAAWPRSQRRTAAASSMAAGRRCSGARL